LFLCQRVNDLPPNAGGVLLSTIDKNNNAQLLLRGKPYVGGSVL